MITTDNTALSECMFVVVSERILPGKMGSATSAPAELSQVWVWESEIAACPDQT